RFGEEFIDNQVRHVRIPSKFFFPRRGQSFFAFSGRSMPAVLKSVALKYPYRSSDPASLPSAGSGPATPDPHRLTRPDPVSLDDCETFSPKPPDVAKVGSAHDRQSPAPPVPPFRENRPDACNADNPGALLKRKSIADLPLPAILAAQ